MRALNKPLNNFDKWKELCERLEIKPLFIENATGENRVQMMCAANIMGTPETVNARVEWLKNETINDGFEILRTKLECPLRLTPDGQIAYYESHVKVLAEANEVSVLNDFCERNQYHLSRSLLNSRKWYVTSRIYGGSAESAHSKFLEVLANTKEKFRVTGIELECAIFDTNPEIDAGWIPYETAGTQAIPVSYGTSPN